MNNCKCVERCDCDIFRDRGRQKLRDVKPHQIHREFSPFNNRVSPSLSDIRGVVLTRKSSWNGSIFGIILQTEKTMEFIQDNGGAFL